jgi:bacillithiol system protein YtxJ
MGVIVRVVRAPAELAPWCHREPGAHLLRIAPVTAPLHWIFKHSPTCPISADALDEVETFRAAHPDVPVEQLDVFADRGRCRAIADATGVRHQSPQVLLCEGDAVLWHASHGQVTAAHMAEAVRTRGAAPVLPARRGYFFA